MDWAERLRRSPAEVAIHDFDRLFAEAATQARLSPPLAGSYADRLPHLQLPQPWFLFDSRPAVTVWREFSDHERLTVISNLTSKHPEFSGREHEIVALWNRAAQRSRA